MLKRNTRISIAFGYARLFFGSMGDFALTLTKENATKLADLLSSPTGGRRVAVKPYKTDDAPRDTFVEIP